MIGNNRPANGEGTIGPMDRKELTDVEKPIPVDAEKPVVICYKYQN